MNKGELTNEIVEIFIKIQWKIQEENRKKKNSFFFKKFNIFKFYCYEEGMRICVRIFLQSILDNLFCDSQMGL